MALENIFASGRSRLQFMPDVATIKGTNYLEVLQTKAPPFIEIKQCTHFQCDGVQYHQTRAVKQ